ncbi:MAG TPA: adenosine deaminase [Gammaproteobacteria bacterium]|nr:adenosine deaminase [Gammaproteobacteria bacterium]
MSTGPQSTHNADDAFIRRLPKVELHLHIEGTLEPEMMFDLADRNRVELSYPSVEAIRAAYDFEDLQSFLDLYYQGMAVLRTERDFEELTRAYLRRCAAENIVHTEMFFDPQAHTERGIPLETVIDGVLAGMAGGEGDFGVTSALILCFLRHLSEDSARNTLAQARPYLDRLAGVGLDSAEAGNPPEKFTHVFREARELGLPVVAHAGEEGPADYIWQALEGLQVRRIDHGVRCTEDDRLVEYLAAHRIPLTVCPLSNIKLRVFDRLADHNLASLLERGLCVTVNSDDPAYFGGYLEENLIAVRDALGLSRAQIVQLALNAVEASFMSDDRKAELTGQIREQA